ncbi:MAG: hypothetical protein KF889_01590 [Alphaproteobacteria bacterium]|nr:hypothetical protein [Alphaproteobacteria bacterium]MCW5741599.1 hypothetical protein [Alphaproteobacteria bacterium]
MSKFADEIAEAVVGRMLNHVPNVDNAVTWRVAKKAASAYTGATANSHGDHDGTADPYTLFTVTGDVMISDFFGVCNTAVVSASDTGTLEVGVAGNTAKIIAQTTAGSGTIAAGDVITDAGSEAGVDVNAHSGAKHYIANGADIIETLATNNFNSGQIDWYCVWAPVEAGAQVVAA